MAKSVGITCKEWKLKVSDEQQLYWKCFHGYQWDTINKFDEQVGLQKLQQKIGFALFGGPTEKNSSLGYDEKQEDHIRKFANLICEKQKHSYDNYYLSFLFVNGFIEPNSHYTEAVIRLPNGFLTEYLFIDSSLRVYKGWDDFLKNNCLPKSLLCYPCNGVYTALDGVVNIVFQQSAACGVGRKVLKAFDITGSAMSLGTLGVGVASAVAAPVIAPVMLGSAICGIAVSTYQMGRCIHVLNDRSQHEQSIGLKDSTARLAWIGAVTAPIAAAASGVTMVTGQMLKSGSTLSMARRIGFGTVAATSCTTSVIGVVNSVVTVIQKACKKECITEMDILNVAASVLFFSNAVISIHQARQLVSSMPAEEQSATTWMMNQFQKLRQIHNGSIVTKNLVSYLENDRIFCNIIFHGCSLAAKYLGIKDKMFKKCYEICSLMFKTAQYFFSGAMSHEEFFKKCIDLATKLWEIIEEDFEDIFETICRHFGIKRLQDFQSRGQCILDSISPQHTIPMAKAVSSAALEYQQKVVNTSPSLLTADAAEDFAEVAKKECQAAIATVVKETVESQDLTTPEDFVKYTVFISEFLNQEIERKEEEYQRALGTHRHLNPNVNVEKFNSVYGIKGNMYSHFLKELTAAVKLGERPLFSKLKFLYHAAQGNTQNTDVEEWFSSSEVNIKLFSWPQCQELSDSQCLSLAEKYIGGPVNPKHVKISKDGSNVLMLFNDQSLEYSTMLIAGFIKEGSISGIIGLIKK